MNLLYEPWIPVIRKSGRQEKIAPWQIVEINDPVIELAAPRPDFNGAMMEFLIGLLQTTAAPENHNQWVDWLESPPSPDTLKTKFESVESAFECMGSAPLFMQDYEDLKGRYWPVFQLLMDSPGDNTIKKNKDHFVKRESIDILCEPCSMMALFTLQTYAAGGGQGHMTSLRGGGPLTTLVMLDPVGSQLENTLWRNLWLNVIEKDDFRNLYNTENHENLADIFPWMAPTRASDSKSGQETQLNQVNPLQMYWGMPRRIRLHWLNESSCCDICGCPTNRPVREFIMQGHGTKYSGTWQHPLSPHYIESKSGQPSPIHIQKDGLSYRNWLGWAQTTENIKSAHIVEFFNTTTKRKLPQEQFRLSVYGYDMEEGKAKARGWHQTVYPLFQIENNSLRKDFVEQAQKLIDSANEVAGFIQLCVKEAWFKRPKDARGDTGFIKEIFYQRTEQEFYQSLGELLKRIPDKKENTVFEDWYKKIKNAAIALFDYWAARGDVSVSDPRRIAAAHQKLNNLLRGKKFIAGLGISNKEKV